MVYFYLNYFVLQFSAQKPAYTQAQSLSFNNSKYSWNKTDNRTEEPKLIPKLMEQNVKIDKPTRETTFQLTSCVENQITITKSFRPNIQNPVTKTRISKQQTTPLNRPPNVSNPLLPKKCPWDFNPRINIDLDKKNAFRSDLFYRFGTVFPVMDTTIILPWNEKYWNFFITNVNGYDDISARLIGDAYSVSTFFFFIFNFLLAKGPLWVG